MWLRCEILVFVTLLSSVSLLSAAQNPRKPNNPNKDEQRENQAVKDAQKDVQDAEKTIREREQDVRERLTKLRSAQQSRQSAASDLQKVEDRLEAEHAESTGLAAAREKLKSIQTELTAKSKPVLDRLKEQSDYKTAQAALDRAKAAIKPDPDRLDTDRKAAVAEHAKAAEKVRELERVALEKVDELKTLMGKETSAAEAVQSAKKKFDRAVEKDSDMRVAKQAFEKAKGDEDKAEDAVAEVQRKLADARGKLAQARQKLQQKVAADLKDDNKGNKNKNKK